MLEKLKFTQQGKSIDDKIRIQLEIIIQTIRDEIPDVKSIILGGGFSRGEGSVKLIKNKIFPLNDYDIYVITEKSYDEKFIDKIANKAANKIGYKGIAILHEFKKSEQKIEKNFYIDLKCLTEKQLKKLLPRLRYYELKYSTEIIYAKDKEDYRNLIPSFKLNQIPFAEGAKLLLDRMSQMCCYFSASKKNYDKDMLLYIIQQAYASCLTSLLLISKKYQVGYYKNMQKLLKTYKKDFPKLNKTIPDLDKRIKRLIEWKLNPNKEIKNPEETFFQCRKDIFEVTKYFLSFYLKKEIKDIDDLSKVILKMASVYYKPYLREKFGILAPILNPLLNLYFKYKYFTRMKNKIFSGFCNIQSPDMIIFAAVPYVLFGIDKNKEKIIENQEMIGKAQELLSKISKIKGKGWEQLSLDYANAYFAFYLQKLN